MESEIFKANNISKQYGNSYAVHNINLTINYKDIYGFVGENGAGKSTLMKIIAGLVRPSDGKISLLGKSDKKGLNYSRKRIGVLFETPALYPNLNAKENLIFYCKIYGINNKNRINEVLKLVSLLNTEDKNTSDFSLGMKQRLGLAVALLNKPDFLILDEPINGIDPSGIVEIRELLKYLMKENGVTILISSHILTELQLLATKIGFIHRGVLIKEISTDELHKTKGSQIHLKTPDLNDTENILKNEFKLKYVLNTESKEILISKENTNLEKLMSILLNKGIRIEAINISSPNLENYYMNLIGGKKK